MKKKLLPIMLAGVLAVVLTGCEAQTSAAPQSNTYQSEAQKVEEVQKKVTQTVPIPNITTSEERKNVAKRAELFNSESKISYIYLVNYGKVMAFYTVKGKVSSLRSYMAPIDKLVDGNGDKCRDEVNGNSSGGYVYKPCYTVEAPDLDGTYGENVSGIFFFTTDGAYVEWKGDYMMSDQPLKLTTQPELVREVK